MLKMLRLQDSAGAIHTARFPQSLITGTGLDPRTRIRVDPAQTSFFEGREFRTFKEWETATTGVVAIRATVPGDIILFELGIQLEAGVARIETLVGGVESGTWSEVLPRFGANTMASRPFPYYVPAVVLESGGVITGGTLLDPLRAKTSDNSNFASSVGTGAGAERGVGAGTYYFRITLTGAIGIFKARWEETLPISTIIVDY